MSRLLITLIAALTLVGAGYWWGHTATDNAWQAQHAKALESERAETTKETERANQATARYLRQHRDQEDRHAALNAVYQDLRRRAPLVVPGPMAAVPICGNAPEPPTPGADQSPAPDAVADLGPELTLAAVRMWNGALTGTDQAAGACSPAGTAEGADAAAAQACTQGAGLTLNDAWTNHAANARSCAEDRQRYQHLIDFLNGK